MHELKLVWVGCSWTADRLLGLQLEQGPRSECFHKQARTTVKQVLWDWVVAQGMCWSFSVGDLPQKSSRVTSYVIP